MQGHEDGLLVGEVLVDRADADARGFRDAIRGDGSGAVTPKHTLRRPEGSLPDPARALLFWFTARERPFGGFHGIKRTGNERSTGLACQHADSRHTVVSRSTGARMGAVAKAHGVAGVVAEQTQTTSSRGGWWPHAQVKVG